MKFYIIAGEASGDLHASNLMKELRKQDVSSTFRCWGGDLMSDQGGQIVKHYRDLAFMGFVEVLANLKTIMGNLRFCKQDILAYQPDAVILVDYPGFNLRIAEFAKKAGFKVFYYISPQIWAWKKSRVYKIKKYVDKMFVILPFEKEFYARYDYKVDFVGHPLLDMINQLPESDRKSFREKNGLNTKPIIALLPGSRKQEIKKMLSGMLSVVKDFPEYQFVIAGAPSQEITFYKELMGNVEVNLVEGQTYSLLQNSHAALVTSGTATLETALFQIPEVVCYKSSAISYWIARMVIDKSIIKFISLVNLIMDKEVVLELIQGDFTSKRIKKELSLLTSDTNYRNKIFNDYQELVEKLGGSGASQKTASGILNALKD
ncbi:MAG TPA: lipid-A-disaccharide synthase [Bacteroidales bacterium]|nr:lipid-A-disaccharide synthase [Bacteroidales bacterium]HRX96621.1 lipid-A-disaccharide synthase [Bacteroidales bacterium]